MLAAGRSQPECAAELGLSIRFIGERWPESTLVSDVAFAKTEF